MMFGKSDNRIGQTGLNCPYGYSDAMDANTNGASFVARTPFGVYPLWRALRAATIYCCHVARTRLVVHILWRALRAATNN